MSINEFKKRLEDILEKKYKEIIFSKKEVYARESIKKEILNLSDDRFEVHKKCISCNFFEKEFKSKKRTISYYRKFNTHLSLKKKYDKNLVKVTNKKACSITLIKLFLKIFKSKNINDLQKLNMLLKINDIVILDYLNNKNISKLILKNFDIEKKLINKFI